MDNQTGNAINKLTKKRLNCRKKFLHYFKKGFSDQKYFDWERGYKWEAHLQWKRLLNEKEFRFLIEESFYNEIAARAVRIESRTNLLFSFEKMALRDAVKETKNAKTFAMALFNLVYGNTEMKSRFEEFIEIVASLPRKQTRVLTWPLVTVFGFIADPKTYIFLKPNVTKQAAIAYGYDLDYISKPNWDTYFSYLEFAALIKRNIKDLKPKDMIDLQSFIWVLGSDEYPD